MPAQHEVGQLALQLSALSLNSACLQAVLQRRNNLLLACKVFTLADAKGE